ncbi:unnamed protein product [Lupinus luteus]|uniref:Nal1 C-terminal domain-containing protein n=1 Tax=Lupinus luteus TaxID=3873 RepID=A0AAV1WNA5_LUPLU
MSGYALLLHVPQPFHKRAIQPINTRVYHPTYPHNPFKTRVASQDTYGTLGAIVRRQSAKQIVGKLIFTNRHVAVDLDYPNQKMFHPLSPTLRPEVYLGAVERSTSFITDELWYPMFARINLETFVRADGAFIPYADDFDISTVTTSVRAVGDIGDGGTANMGRHKLKIGQLPENWTSEVDLGRLLNLLELDLVTTNEGLRE